MNDILFNQFIKSVQQTGKISRGEMKPKRSFHYKTIDIRTIRNKTGLTQEKFALMVGIPL